MIYLVPRSLVGKAEEIWVRDKLMMFLFLCVNSLKERFSPFDYLAKIAIEYFKTLNWNLMICRDVSNDIHNTLSTILTAIWKRQTGK